MNKNENSDGKNKRLFPGVDGGGTKTHVILCESNGNILPGGEGYGGPSNPNTVGIRRSVDNIVGAINQAFATNNRDLDPEELGGIVVGLAGVGNPRTRAEMLGALRAEECLKGVPLCVMTDQEIAIASVSMNSPAIAVISGTGSGVLAQDSTGEQWRTDGHGLGGDRGSGPWIGLNGLQDFYKSVDGILPPTSLSGPIFDHFKVKTVPDLTTRIAYFNRDISAFRQTLGSLVPIFAREAYRGDSISHNVFVRAANALADSTIAVINKAGLKHSAFHLGMVGGVWKVGDILRKPFLFRVTEFAPSVQVRLDLPLPAHAAALMAIAKFGTT